MSARHQEAGLAGLATLDDARRLQIKDDLQLGPGEVLPPPPPVDLHTLYASVRHIRIDVKVLAFPASGPVTPVIDQMKTTKRKPMLELHECSRCI